MTSAPIRVLQLGSPTGLYGAERWILALVRHLPAPIESIVGAVKDAPGPQPPVCVRAAEFGLRTQVFEAHGRFNFDAVRLVREYLLEQRIDVLHTHGYKTDFLGWLAVRGTPCQVLSTPHGWNPNEHWKVRAYEGLGKLVLSRLHKVAPLSQQIYDELARIPGTRRKLHLIRNGVDLSEIKDARERAPELVQWHAQGDWIVGYIGRLSGPKRIDTLVRAFARAEVPGKRLCIVGEGPEREALEQLARELGCSERVHFFGYREDRIAFLKCFDAFVLPSETEGTPRCLMEAMTAEVPVFASDIRGCRLLIESEATGWLFAVGDDATLSQQLVTAFQRRDEAASRARAARAFVEANYSAEAMAQSYARLFREMTASPPNNASFTHAGTL
jgi:glycosyltransferase involved in cell wall biosynthesis